MLNDSGYTLTLSSGGSIGQASGGLIEAATANLTAPSGTGASGNASALQVGTLTANSSASNGNQFLSEAGTAALAGSNALNAGSGTIDLAGGTFNLSGNNQVSSSSTLQVDAAATFGIAGSSDTVAQLIIKGGTVSGTTGVLTSTAMIDGQSGFANAILAGGNGLAETTAGTLTLSGANIYIGATTIDAGTLQVGIANAIHPAPRLPWRTSPVLL